MWCQLTVTPRTSPGSRCAAAEAELADVRRHMEWQEHRIEELQQTGGVALARRYDAELQGLRAEFDAERMRLEEELAEARRAVVAKSQQLRLAASASGWVSGDPDAAAWAELLDDPTQIARQESAVQTDDSSLPHGSSAADENLMLAAQAEIEQLQAVNAALLASQEAAQCALQEATHHELHLANSAKFEAAVAAAVKHERSLAQTTTQQAEAGWRTRLGLVQEQLQHQASEVRALREANEKLELALHAARDELERRKESGDRRQRAAEEQEGARNEEVRSLQNELALAKQQSEALQVQVLTVKAAVERQQQEHVEEVARLAKQVALADDAQAAAEAAGQQQTVAFAELEARVGALSAELSALHAEQQQKMDDRANIGMQTDAVHARDAAIQAETTAPPPSELAAMPTACGTRPSVSPAHSPSHAAAALHGPVQSSLTASMLQLELARVSLTPQKSLPGLLLRPQTAVAAMSSAAVPPCLVTWNNSNRAQSSQDSKHICGAAAAPLEQLCCTPTVATTACNREDAFATPTSTIAGLETDQGTPLSHVSILSPSCKEELAAHVASPVLLHPISVPRLDLTSLSGAGQAEQRRQQQRQQQSRPATAHSADSLWSARTEDIDRKLEMLGAVWLGSDSGGAATPAASTSLSGSSAKAAAAMVPDTEHASGVEMGSLDFQLQRLAALAGRLQALV